MNSVAVSFVLYTLGIVALGLYSARFARRTSEDFFLANRGLGAWVAALSSSASAESGWVTLGLVGMAFETGVSALWILVGAVLAFLFNWYVMAPRLRQASLDGDALTIPDLLACKFHGSAALVIRLLGILLILSMLATYVAAQLNAAGKTFHGTFGIPYATGVLIGATIVLVYTITGGFRAVAWTDVVQSFFMVAAMIVLPLVIMAKVGGPAATLARLDELDPAGNLTAPFGGNTGLALLGFLTTTLGISLGYPGAPHVIVRLMAVKDDVAVRRAALISTVWVGLLTAGAIGLGIVARAYYGSLDDPEQVLPLAAADASIVPGVIGGMMVAAILAAICSTADSQLLVSASAVSHDLMVRVLGRERKQSENRDLAKRRVLLDRLAVLAIGLIATVVAVGEVRQVFAFVLDYGWAVLGAAFGPPLILTMLWRGTTGWGVVAGMITGSVVAVAWKLAAANDLLPPALADIYNLVPAFGLALAATVALSWLTKDPSRYPQ